MRKTLDYGRKMYYSFPMLEEEVDSPLFPEQEMKLTSLSKYILFWKGGFLTC